MTDLIAATIRLAAALAAENAALQTMDLPSAGAMLAEKTDAAAAFEAARKAASPAGSPALREAAARLMDQAAQNRRLLERAIGVQTRVLGVIARAARTAQPAPRYGRSGAYANRPTTGWALSARA